MPCPTCARNLGGQKMSRTARTCLTILALLSSPALIHAQTTQAKDAPVAKASANKKPPNAPAEQRRMTALSLLTALADEAKGYHDQVLRARVQARAADALWDS